MCAPTLEIRFEEGAGRSLSAMSGTNFVKLWRYSVCWPAGFVKVSAVVFMMSRGFEWQRWVGDTAWASDDARRRLVRGEARGQGC